MPDQEAPIVAEQLVSTAPGDHHHLLEDALAMLMGTALVALGITFYNTVQLATGGTAGLSLLIGYLSGYSFSTLFFLINLPFYLLAILRMGWQFTLRTFAAVFLVSILVRLTAGWLSLGAIAPLYASLMGGALIGVGLLVLFRHRTSLGGVNILALFLQDRFGIRTGYVLLAVDLAILVFAFMVLDVDKVALSLLGAVIVNLIITVNHKPGRYMGIS